MARILVVDDEASMCDSCKQVLARDRHRVDTALSGQEALAKIGKETYDVVITDMMMPVMSGMELLETVKRRWPEISVIMITGYATIRTAVQAIKLGAFDYIPKPFTPEELRAVTTRAVERRRLFEHERAAAEEPVAEEAPKSPEEMPVTRPTDLYSIPEHSWAKVEDDGTVRIGMEDVFQKTVGEIINIDLPLEGDRVKQGNVCVRISSPGMHIHKLWSPVGGEVKEVNYELEEDPSLPKKDPYGKGWVLRLLPSSLEEDLKNLLHAEP